MEIPPSPLYGIPHAKRHHIKEVKCPELYRREPQSVVLGLAGGQKTQTSKPCVTSGQLRGPEQVISPNTF